MPTKRKGFAVSPEDERLIQTIQKALAKDQGTVSEGAAIRYALRQTVAMLKRKGA